MKIRIVKFVPREQTGMMVDLYVDEVIAVDNSVAQQLIDSGYAEIEI